MTKIDPHQMSKYEEPALLLVSVTYILTPQSCFSSFQDYFFSTALKHDMTLLACGEPSIYDALSMTENTGVTGRGSLR